MNQPESIASYTVEILGMNGMVGDVMVCKLCGYHQMATDRMDGFYLGAKHYRLEHKGK